MSSVLEEVKNGTVNVLQSDVRVLTNFLSTVDLDGLSELLGTMRKAHFSGVTSESDDDFWNFKSLDNFISGLSVLRKKGNNTLAAFGGNFSIMHGGLSDINVYSFSSSEQRFALDVFSNLKSVVYVQAVEKQTDIGYKEVIIKKHPEASFERLIQDLESLYS